MANGALQPIDGLVSTTFDVATPKVAILTGVAEGGFGRRVGIYGSSEGNVGVWGHSRDYEGVHADTYSSTTAAIAAYNLNSIGTGAAIYAKKEGSAGHAGFFHGKVHIQDGSLSVTYSGSFGPSTSDIKAASATLRAKTTAQASVGVAGEASSPLSGIGLYGKGKWGVCGTTRHNSGVAVIGLTGDDLEGAKAGEFVGDVVVWGDLHISGDIVGFRIDHPLDPRNRYLNHRPIESSERKNVYDGIATLDKDGEATVQLPEWIDALNDNFRYQLTCVGACAPVYISEEINQNRFRISGGTDGLKVSWQVTGVRKDPWARANPVIVDEIKRDRERGRYMFAQGYGAEPGKNISAMLRQQHLETEGEILTQDD